MHPVSPSSSCPRGKQRCYLQATGFDPDSHILGVTAFVLGLQGEWTLIVILTVRVFFSILKEKDILEMTSGKHNQLHFQLGYKLFQSFNLLYPVTSLIKKIH